MDMASHGEVGHLINGVNWSAFLSAPCGLAKLMPGQCRGADHLMYVVLISHWKRSGSWPFTAVAAAARPEGWIVFYESCMAWVNRNRKDSLDCRPFCCQSWGSNQSVIRLFYFIGIATDQTNSRYVVGTLQVNSSKEPLHWEVMFTVSGYKWNRDCQKTLPNVTSATPPTALHWFYSWDYWVLEET